MAGELLMSVSQDERERAIAISRKKFQTDMQSDMATAEDRGRAEGRLDVARNMKADGEPVDKIMRYSGLTREEVEDLSLK